MYDDSDLFRIETNHVAPSRGKVLISEPFLLDHMFGRSVVLLIDHTAEGSMGLVMNKPLPLSLNDIITDLEDEEDIPLYKGGPLSMDTLFYLHTIEGVSGALPISQGFYLNGDFNDIKRYIKQGNPLAGHIRFFLGYSGWQHDQLNQEIEDNTWMIGTEEVEQLMDEPDSPNLWKNALCNLGSKYQIWSRFPQIPSMN